MIQQSTSGYLSEANTSITSKRYLHPSLHLSSRTSTCGNNPSFYEEVNEWRKYKNTIRLVKLRKSCYLWQHILSHIYKCICVYIYIYIFMRMLLLLLLSRFSHVRLCNPIDSSPPGSPFPGILQARTLECVAISFSNAWKWKVKVKLLSRAWLLATPWTAAYQAPPSMGFSRQECWSGVPLPSPHVRVYYAKS